MVPKADLILHNARVLTLDPARPRAGAVAIRGEHILAVGEAAAMEVVAGPHTRTLDLGGATLVPGFNDAHCHLLGMVQALLSVDVSAARSIPEIQGLVRRRAAALPPGEWVVATGYDDFQLAERRHPQRRDLDAAAPAHPVRLLHRTGHAWVLSSAALERLHIGIDTEEPPGGLMERELDTGEPSGVFFGMGDFLRERLPPLSQAQLREGVSRASASLLADGITSIQDTSQGNGPEQWRLFCRWQQEGWLQPRLTAMVGFPSLGLLAEGGGSPAGQPYPRLRGVKLVLEGATGRLHPPPEELEAQVAQVHGQGYPVAIHAVEEAAVAAVAAALERVLRPAGGGPRPHRHRIEHCAECPPPLQRRLARLRVTVVTQPAFIYYRGEKYLAEVSPPAGGGLPHLYPTASLLRAGLRVAGSSDAPVVPPHPLVGIYAAVTRRTQAGGQVAPGEAISPEAALALYTTGAAYAAGEEGEKGCLAPGKLADLAVLSADPTAVPPEQIKDIRVTMTLLGGRVVWSG